MSHALKHLLENLINPKNNWKITLLYQWHDIIGNLHTKVQIETIQESTLVLGVSHSSWMQELYVLSPLIIKTINEKLEHPYIKNIRFKYISQKKKTVKKQKAEMLYNNNVQLNTQDELILSKITDPALKDALKAFRMRCYRESS